MSIALKGIVPPNPQEECSICYAPLTEKDVVGHTTKNENVNHLFHKSCIEPWVVEHKTCPVCRCPLKASVLPRLERCLIDGAFATFVGLTAAIAGAAMVAAVTKIGTAGAGIGAVAGVAGAGILEGGIYLEDAPLNGARLGGLVTGIAVIGIGLAVKIMAVGQTLASGVKKTLFEEIMGVGPAAGIGAASVAKIIFNRISPLKANHFNTAAGLLIGCCASLLMPSAGVPTTLSTISLVSGIAAGGIAALRHFVLS